MSGTLWIGADEPWMPATWIFGSVLARSAEKIRHARPDIADMLDTGAERALLDLRDYTAALVVFRRALDLVRADIQSRGDVELSHPKFVPIYLAHLDKLRLMLDEALRGSA